MKWVSISSSATTCLHRNRVFNSSNAGSPDAMEYTSLTFTHRKEKSDAHTISEL